MSSMLHVPRQRFHQRCTTLGAKRRRHRVLRLESLESRQLLAADLQITEFMAANDTTLSDSSGNMSDWIEIHNAGADQTSLAGWTLTDDAGDLDKWEFPALSLDPGQYLVVFASGEDRRPLSYRLTRDYNATIDGTFAVDLPAGSYEIRMTLGDATKPRDETAIYVQGELMDVVSTEAGEFAGRTAVAQVGDATDGRLTIRFEDQSVRQRRAIINALVITPTGGGDPMRFDFGTVDSPVELGYTRVTATDTYETSAGHGWLSGPIYDKDRGTDKDEPHTNFKLSSGGEYVALISPAGVVVSEYGPDGSDYPVQLKDISYGVPVNGGTPGYLAEPTPGAENSLKRCASVVFDRPNGVFHDPFPLTLSVDTPGATIHFTTDGSEPTETSPLYVGPITISATTDIQAIAVAPGLSASTPSSAWFLTVDADLDDFSSDLPIMVFENFDHDLPGQDIYQFNAMAVFEPGGDGARTSLLGTPTVATRSGLKKRGSLSRRQAKANYALEIWDNQNRDTARSLLGMPADSDWVLYAPYDYDRAMLRNPFVFELSNQMGRYAPRTRYVEVYLNTTGGDVSAQDYYGVYVLMEKIKRGPDRVDIQKLKPRDESEPEISGGWLLKIDPLDPGDQGFQVDGESRRIAYVDPKEVEVTDVQAEWIRDHLNAMHAAFVDTDPETGYAKYIDVDSWIDYHILNTFPMNTDALRRSVYFSKDRGGKIEMGPLWDFNRSMEVADLPRDDNPEAWQNPGVLTDYFGQGWWGELFKDPNFKQKWIDRWFELRRDILSWSHVESMIDSLASEVAEAQVRNFERWPEKPPRTADDSTYKAGALDGTWEGEVAQLKAWVFDRLAWIDSQFALPPMITPSAGRVSPGQEITLSGGSGPIYYTTDGSDPRLPGGAINPDAVLVEDGVPLVFSEPISIVARALPDGQWSAPVTARFLVAGVPDDATALKISEINYHPYDPSNSERSLGFGADDFEFIELVNTGDHAIDLAGVTFVDGIEFTFDSNAAGSVAPGERVLVVADADAFAARYGTGLPVVGAFDSGKLRDGGEQIVTVDRYGVVIQDFAYNNSGRWPGRADGTGSTLEVIDTAGDFGDAENWRASSEYGGSPGTAGTGPVFDVLINEVLSRGENDDPDRIELYNRTNHTVDLSGWRLSDDKNDLRKTAIPAGTTIGAGEYLVLNRAELGFGLSGTTGDDVWLMESDGSGRLARFVDHVKFNATDVGVALGRWPNGDPRGILFPMTSASFGAINSGPRTGAAIVSELHYHPSTGSIMAADFSDGTTNRFAPVLGTWGVQDGGYEVTPGPEGDTISTISTDGPLPTDFVYSATLHARTVAGFSQNAALIFDYHSPTDFKFVGMFAGGDKWKIGQRDASGWNFLHDVPTPIEADTDIPVTLTIHGSSARLVTSGAVFSWDFQTPLNNGRVGVGSKNGTGRFDDVKLETPDNPKNFEFVELMGTRATPVDLAGWRLSGGVDLTFAAGTTLAAGETLVVVGFDPASGPIGDAFRVRFGMDAGVPMIGPYAGSLSNAGETVRVLRPIDPVALPGEFTLVDSVRYDDQPPWPAAADGAGASLQRKTVDAFGSLASSWAANTPTPGGRFTALVGDTDLNGQIDGDDVRAFVLALSNPSAYQAAYGVSASMTADVDGDGDVDVDDIDNFVALVGGGVSASPVPAVAGSAADAIVPTFSVRVVTAKPPEHGQRTVAARVFVLRTGTADDTAVVRRQRRRRPVRDRSGYHDVKREDGSWNELADRAMETEPTWRGRIPIHMPR